MYLKSLINSMLESIESRLVKLEQQMEDVMEAVRLLYVKRHDDITKEMES